MSHHIATPTKPMQWLKAMVLLVMLVLAQANAFAQATVTFFHNDIAGTPLAATDSAGNLVWKETYRPYGDRLTQSPASSGNGVWFAGKPQDARTGLVYMGARYYDPTIGRFMGTDPVGFVEGNVHSVNRYAYANNNPYRYVDPDGREALVATGVGILVIGSVYYALAPPDKQREMRESISRLSRAISSVLHAESAESSDEVKVNPNGANSAAGGAAPPPDGGDNDKDKVRFGKNANQESHAFRHVDEAGLDRGAVRDSIKQDLSKVSDSLKEGLYNGRVNVNGTQVDYAAYKFSDGTINVGRITPPR